MKIRRDFLPLSRPSISDEEIAAFLIFFFEPDHLQAMFDTFDETSWEIVTSPNW